MDIFLNVLRKLLIRVFNNRESEFLQKERVLDDDQAGFTVLVIISTLLSLINHYRNVTNKDYMYDLRKTFDKTSHSVLW